MHIELVSTGDEIVTGLVVDTNAAWLSALLLEQGWQVRRRHTVGDDLEAITQVLAEAAARSDVVLVCGGLGPTSDDLTAEAAARAFSAPLELREAWLEVIRARYASRGRVMAESNAKQAWLPRGSRLIDNPVGTACGFRVDAGACRLYFTPGVPFEFKQMVQQQILPELAAGQDTRLRRFYTFGVPESTLSDALDRLEWPQGVVLGYRSSMPLIELKLIGHEVDDGAMGLAEAQLLAHITPWLVGEGSEPPWAHILRGLKGEPLYLLECASGGALQRMCRDYPHLHARFEATLGADPAALVPQPGRWALLVGEESEQGVALVLQDGERRFEQLVLVRHPDRPSRERILAFCALDMLRRHLAGHSPFGEYQTLTRTLSRAS
ncbi:molybdopterin-binding protein [Aeromonas simiae]|uniref:molybdopterin-binding protein n=1 Tax=Aeromonas simiae TaxID=218936 RepID=UPI0005A68665|nr:molybdopterin-binding protein [Aeromonas simiae]